MRSPCDNRCEALTGSLAKAAATSHPGRCPRPGGDAPEHSGQHPLDL